MNNFSSDLPLDNEWTCSVSRNKIHQGYTLSGFLAIVGLAFLTVMKGGNSDSLTIGLILLAGSALIGFINFKRDRNTGPLLILKDEGLWYKDWSGPVIGWKDIQSVKLGGSKIKASVRVTLNDPQTVISRLNADKRSAFEKNALINMPVLRIPAGSLDKPLDEICDKINAFMVNEKS